MVQARPVTAQARPVTLQISVAPTDLPHAVHTLPHQLRQWSGQVREILFTFDLHRTARGGRFGEGWQERLEPMQRLLEDLCREHPSARVAPVDYAPETMREIALRFLDGPFIPAKDTKGAPFYPYFYGLRSACHDLVFHLDSDLMFGGSSQTWVDEACMLLSEHPDVLACSPLPGPPTPEGQLRGQSTQRFGDGPFAFRFSTMNTRLFLIDRIRLRERVLPLQLLGPIRLTSRVKARLHGNPPYSGRRAGPRRGHACGRSQPCGLPRGRARDVVASPSLPRAGVLQRAATVDRASRVRAGAGCPARGL